VNWTELPKPIYTLAPMADYTDSPFCRVCREVENYQAHKVTDQPFVIFREMVSAEAIVRGNEKTLKMCEFEEIERPIVLQLFGSKPEVIVEAARILLGKGNTSRPPAGGHPSLEGISGIDINMGCPVPKIAGKAQSGAYLMKDHERAVEIVKALKMANLGLPISVKTRLGWSKKEDILEFAPKLEQAGADAITLHGRTKTQGYSGVADWEMIGRVKNETKIKIPIIANGDIKLENAKECLEITHADGLMIGRGALGRPWIFQQFPISLPRRQAGNFQFPNTIDEIKKIVLRHAQLHIEYYGSDSMVTFRKHLLWYFKNLPHSKALRQELVKVKTMDELKKLLEF